MASMTQRDEGAGTGETTSSRAPFHGGVRPGEQVKYLAYAGMGLKGPEYKVKSGRAVMVFPDRIVLNGGGRHGTPVVVTAANYSAPG